LADLDGERNPPVDEFPELFKGSQARSISAWRWNG
jgi:hypothetical protein